MGCDLLSDLMPLSVGHTPVIDLETIDFSNINRQFLLRRGHNGLPKATDATSSLMTMLPAALIDTVVGTLGNIKDVTFDVDMFNQFHVVCHELDHLEASRLVNRMCLATGVPLIDSRSTGYFGQCEG